MRPREGPKQRVVRNARVAGIAGRAAHRGAAQPPAVRRHAARPPVRKLRAVQTVPGVPTVPEDPPIRG